ncbi:hypothetical protein ElyMa_002208400 [Elysia marginata]|uniref:Uncharacterized protein n=1 Tax=Elysia marginata TaxID=1093978 RepID=A0AAV4FS52_9GAST|nr:hypothetical protein ElyMa_002208400 [Elysia marginata]
MVTQNINRNYYKTLYSIKKTLRVKPPSCFNQSVTCLTPNVCGTCFAIGTSNYTRGTGQAIFGQASSRNTRGHSLRFAKRHSRSSRNTRGRNLRLVEGLCRLQVATLGDATSDWWKAFTGDKSQH